MPYVCTQFFPGVVVKAFGIRFLLFKVLVCLRSGFSFLAYFSMRCVFVGSSALGVVGKQFCMFSDIFLPLFVAIIYVHAVLRLRLKADSQIKYCLNVWLCNDGKRISPLITFILSVIFCMCVLLAAAEVDYNVSRKDDKCDIYGSSETMKFIWCHVSPLERNLQSHFNYKLWAFNLWACV